MQKPTEKPLKVYDYTVDNLLGQGVRYSHRQRDQITTNAPQLK